MSKLPALTSKDAVKVLERAGFRFIRQKGSHKIFVKADRMVVVPWHTGDLRTGTLRHIIQHSGLTVEEFLALL